MIHRLPVWTRLPASSGGDVGLPLTPTVSSQLGHESLRLGGLQCWDPHKGVAPLMRGPTFAYEHSELTGINSPTLHLLCVKLGCFHLPLGLP